MAELDQTKTRMELIEKTYMHKLNEMENKMSDLQVVIDHISRRIHTEHDPRTLTDILHDFDKLERDSQQNFQSIEDRAIQRYEKLEKEIQSNRDRFVLCLDVRSYRPIEQFFSLKKAHLSARV